MVQPGASLTPGRPAASADSPHSSADRLVRAFNDMRDELVSSLLYLLGNREDAQDAAQEAFIKCWRSQESLPDVQNIRAWIFRVGLNTAKDMQRSAWSRKAKPFLADETLIEGRDGPPAEQLEEQEDLTRLQQALLDLRPDEKEVFLLRQNGGLTYEEIADLRKAPVGTVKTQMRSALQKLRKVLAPRPTEL
jgi:RNA polymerase sigma-70 factor (ECF subfamily)